MKIRDLAIIMMAVSFFLNCGQRHVSGPTDGAGPTSGYLSGEWDVLHRRFDGVVVGTSYLTISHVDTLVCFIEETDTISTGIIVADTIRCTDMYGLGISRIFVDDEDHMHSELPLEEHAGSLGFIRQKEFGLSAKLTEISIVPQATFSPPFSPEVVDYYISFSSYPRSFVLTATAEDSAASILVNDVQVASGQEIQVNTSPPQFIVNIAVSSADGNNSKIYVLIILDE